MQQSPGRIRQHLERRPSIRFSRLFPLFLLLSGCQLLDHPNGRAELPNVVVILADDLGWGDLGFYQGASKIPTRNLAILASEGVIFTDAHSPSAVCTPTRYGLLTGRYAWRSRLESGVLGGRSPALIEAGRRTLPSLLSEVGYHTVGVGKWHLGLQEKGPTDYSRPLRPGPVTQGFDTYFGIPASLDMEPYLWIEGDGVEALATETVSASKQRRKGGGGFWRAGAIAPGFRHEDVLVRVGERAVFEIEAHARGNDGKPLFLYLPLPAPHTPWMPVEEVRGASGAGDYGDFVVQVDGLVGSVMAALERGGLAADTLLIFTSDNGAHWLESDIERYGHLANGNWRGQKADIHEGGHRVPFVVRWPAQMRARGIEGSRRDDLLCLTDIFATIAEVVGLSMPDAAAEDSFSQLGAILAVEGTQEPRQNIVHHSLSGLFAIRQGRWKLILGRGSGGFTAPRRIDPKKLAAGEPHGQLYDLVSDPGESRNLYNDHPAVVERLTELLEKLRKDRRSRSGGAGDAERATR